MRKKCVRWTKSVRGTLVAIVIISLPILAAAQSADPTTQPRLTAESLRYVGGFRLPATTASGDSFSLGGRQLTFNPASNTLIVGSRAGRVAEVTIPSAVTSGDVNVLPFATYLQGFSDPTEGHLSDIASDGVSLYGLLVHNNRLYGTASIYYDAMNTQRVSHYSHSLQLNQSSFSGWSPVWDATKSGYVSGAMATVPAEWQSLLGGPVITGQCCIPIVTRTSWGPSAFAFDPANIGQPATIAARPLLYYTSDHQTLGPWDGSNPVYGATAAMGGMAVIAGTRTILYFGRNGTGPHCYGNGTSDQSLDGKPSPDGSHWCYDPTSSDKGSHAYPYRYQVWAYDLNDFVAVKNGVKQPWDIKPYAVWPLTFPTPDAAVFLGGVGYDAAHQMLYVSQMYADRDGYSYRPVIHAFQIDASLSTAAPLTEVKIDANKSSPQPVNTPITFTATATGGVSPQYRWSVNDGTSWTYATGWTTSTQFTWAPAVANANYRVMVGVRNGNSTSETPDVSATASYAITSTTSLTASSATLISGISLAANRPSPQVALTAITLTAQATGGVMPYEYKWVLHNGTSWAALTGWSQLNTFTWTPSTANAAYRIGVWARSAGNTKDEAESSTSSAFAISDPTPVPVTSVNIAASKTAPQTAGTAITWTATPNTGATKVEYKWLLYDGSPSWIPLTGWSATNAFTWTPAVANPNYKIGVWVRGNGSGNDAPQASASAEFSITDVPSAQTVTVNTVSTGPVTSASIALTTAVQAVVGKTINVTATANGGAAPYQFKWLIYDGASWTQVTGWSTSNTFAWTPTRPDPNYIIGVWVKSANNSKDELEVSATLPFPIAPLSTP